MNKIEVIARRILGWKLNSSGKWYDYENDLFIHDFQPEENLDHAKKVVERLVNLGFTYTPKGDSKVCFDDVCATGHTLAQAITNAAYAIADNSTIEDEWL